jgi:hypothetical protein
MANSMDALPLELIHLIAAHLLQSDIYRYALADPRYRRPCQEALFHAPIVPEFSSKADNNKLPIFLRFLFSRPDLAQRVRHLTLYPEMVESWGNASCEVSFDAVAAVESALPQLKGWFGVQTTNEVRDEYKLVGAILQTVPKLETLHLELINKRYGTRQSFRKYEQGIDNKSLLLDPLTEIFGSAADPSLIPSLQKITRLRFHAPNIH